MHPRTKRDHLALNPLTFAPLQEISNADGDTFEVRGAHFPGTGFTAPPLTPADPAPPTWQVFTAVVLVLLFFICLIACLIARDS